jgi:hypothetical protein
VVLRGLLSPAAARPFPDDGAFEFRHGADDGFVEPPVWRVLNDDESLLA